MSTNHDQNETSAPDGRHPASASAAISFRPLTHADLPLLAEWMRGADWRRWWGEPEVELGFIRDMIEGRDTSRPFLFEIDGQPMGYIQYWFIGDHQTEEWISDNPWLAALPADTVGVDLSIGPPDALSRGIGSVVLREFALRLVAEGHGSIIIDPDPQNARAVRAYGKAGFRIAPELLGMCRDCIIMRFDPQCEQQEPQFAS